MSRYKGSHRGPLTEDARNIWVRIGITLVVAAAILLLTFVRPPGSRALTLTDPGNWKPTVAVDDERGRWQSDASLDTSQVESVPLSLGTSIGAVSRLIDEVRYTGTYVAAYLQIGEWEREGFVRYTGEPVTDEDGNVFQACFIKVGDTSILRCLGGYEATS